jgi:hypothetical protein
MENSFQALTRKQLCSIYGIIYGDFFIAQIKGEQ